MQYIIYLWKNFDRWHPVAQIAFYITFIVTSCTLLAYLQGKIF
jgi:hypothetical protein